MKVALIGASGYVGSRVLAEALQRGHTVTALVRHPEKVTPHAHLTVKQVDVLKVDELAKALGGHDVVISAFNPARQSLAPGKQGIWPKNLRANRGGRKAAANAAGGTSADGSAKP